MAQPPVATGRVPGDDTVSVAIEAGGSGIRVRATRNGVRVHEGSGGPGNPLAIGAADLEHNYDAALRGCPTPGHVVACVAGAGSDVGRRRIEELLRARFPGAVLRVLPDYVAADAAAPPGTDVAVIAGTGSLVCSRRGDRLVTSGGRGWLLGDHGSAARLGQALLEWYVNDPDGVAATFAPQVRDRLGTDDWRALVTAIHAAPAPGAEMALAAPILTVAAEQGHAWARARLDSQMGALAATVRRHTHRYLERPDRRVVAIGLVGGVWNSAAAVMSFSAALEQDDRWRFAVRRSEARPIDGATRLAEELGR